MQLNLNTDLIRLWVEPATKASNDALYKVLTTPWYSTIAGRTPSPGWAAREKMIHSNMGLVISQADHFLVFLPQFKHLRDDLISNGLVGLVDAVNKMSEEVPGANPTNLMSLSINSALGHAVQKEETIHIPNTTKRRRKKEGQPIKPHERVTSFDDSNMDQMFSYDPRPMRNLRETLDSCCENETEREILRLREEGHVDREIADILDLPLTTTYVMRRTMYARFLELSGWKGEA